MLPPRPGGSGRAAERSRRLRNPFAAPVPHQKVGQPYRWRLSIAPLAAAELLAEHLAQRRAARALVAHVLAVVVALVQRGLDAERDLALVRAHVDDLHVELVAFLHHVAPTL